MNGILNRKSIVRTTRTNSMLQTGENVWGKNYEHPLPALDNKKSTMGFPINIYQNGCAFNFVIRVLELTATQHFLMSTLLQLQYFDRFTPSAPLKITSDSYIRQCPRQIASSGMSTSPAEFKRFIHLLTIS